MTYHNRKKFPRNCRFQTESINPKVFINGIQKNAVILLNHNKQMVVSNKFNAKETHNGVEVEVDLDPRNVLQVLVFHIVKMKYH